LFPCPFPEALEEKTGAVNILGENPPHATQSCLSELFSFQHHPRGTFVYTAQCSLREAWGEAESPWGHGLSAFTCTAVRIHGAEAARLSREAEVRACLRT